ncbi:hypothetical protein ACFFRR_010368 [Megaselia abdita]
MKVLLPIVLAVLVSQANAYSPEKTCEIVQTNTFIANPEDCSGYYYCVNGAISFQGNCEQGLLYNSYTGSCDYADNVKCNFGSSVCEGVAGQMYKADPISCSSYIFCDGKGNTLYNNCPPGQIFDVSTTSCIWGTSCSGDACELVPNNKFVGNGKTVNDEGKTVFGSMTCLNGRGSPNWCDEGYIYNSIAGQCEYSPEENVSCEKAVAFPPETNLFIASPTNCNQYYYCKDTVATTVPTLLSCPPIFHFDPTKNTCVNSWTYKPQGDNVNCDRCGGYTNNNWVVNNKKSGCGNYVGCKLVDNVGVSKPAPEGLGSCPTGHPYFNEYTQTCQAEKQGNSVFCT